MSWICVGGGPALAHIASFYAAKPQKKRLRLKKGKRKVAKGKKAGSDATL